MLNIYHSELNTISADKLIESLKDRDRNQKHIIITPDKSSLYYERKLFSLTNEDSFFDVTTTTLSRFANNVIGVGDKILSKQGGILIIKRLLIENMDKLNSFNKSAGLIGFAGTLFDTICMFKSCNISPSDIDEVNSVTLNNKLKDIKLIYEKYEEYLKQEYTDSFNRLNLCASKISKEEFRDVNFYFVGFQDFTKQGYLIIEKLLKCSNSVNIATVFAKKNNQKNNYNIYLNSVYYNMIDLAKLIGINYNIIKIDNTLNEEKDFLINNIGANKLSKYNKTSEYVKLLKYDTVDDEIKNTALSIKNDIIIKNLKFKNFAIIVSDMELYKKKLIDNFEKLDLSYFIDESVKLKDTLLARFVSNLISLLYKPNKYNVINFLKCPLLSLERLDIDKYLNYIDKFEPFGNNLLKLSEFNFNKYFDVLLKFNKDKEDNVNTLLNNIKTVLDEINFSDKVEKLMQLYFDKNDLKNYRMIKQSYDKILKIFDEIKVLNNYECTYFELKQYFDLYAENSGIAIPPVVVDSIFVTNLDCENVNDIDYVYFLGFNEGSAPRYNVDNGIISDDEIEKMPIKSKLNPTINIINKRLKFKLFELLFVANKQIIVSYALKNNSIELYPNLFINNLKNIYQIAEIENGSNNLDIINNNIVDFKKDNFIYNNMSKSIAIDNFVYLLKFWNNYSDNKNYIKLLSNLNEVIGDNIYVENLMYNNNIDELNVKLFLSKNKIGISEVERFNMCPYMHFVDYGLKLKPSEKNDLSKIDIGNIIHEFVKVVVFKLDGEDVSRDILIEILKKDEYKYLVENKKNNFIIKSLYDEVSRIFRVLKYQQDSSKFKVFKTEMPFSAKICKIDGNDICITGVVDRIDKFENGIRVIDYKTGKISFKNFEDVYYGNKIQVILYLSIICKNNNLQPLGALYLPISNAFSDNKAEELYKMEGIIEKSLQNLTAFDKNIENINYNSDIIGITTTSKGEISNNNYYKTMCLSNDEIRKLCKFVEENVVNAIISIDRCVINPNPLDENCCKYCEYKGICNFSEKYNNKFRKNRSIGVLSDIFEEVEDE